MKIVFLDKQTLGDDIDLKCFREIGEFEAYESTLPGEILKRIKDAEVIISNKVYISADIMEKSPHLKLICISATGKNNVDLKAAEKHNIEVKNVENYSTNSVAQHTFALLLSLMEQLSYYDNFVKQGHYQISRTFTHLGPKYNELNGKVFGIIGLGNIGKKVAEIASAFGMRVLYYSTSGHNNSSDYERVDLVQLLNDSDVVSVHSPLNKNTKDLLKLDEIKKMKNSAFLLNLGRGGIINEEDLKIALDQDLIAGAATDVFSEEPPVDGNPLMDVKNKDKIILTPHIAWTSIESRMELIRQVCENIKRFYKL